MTTKSRLSSLLSGWETDLDKLERALKRGVCCAKFKKGAGCASGAVVDLHLATHTAGKVQAQVERRGGRISVADRKRRVKLAQRASRLTTRFESSCLTKNKTKVG